MTLREDIFDAEFIARLQQLRLLVKRLTARQTPGLTRSRRVGDGLEFADHRDYAPGDDVRFIDWPYYARMGKLLLRLFHEHSDAEVAILPDSSASTAPGGDDAVFRYALRTTAALAFVAMAGMDRVSINPFAERLATAMRCGRSKENILGVLDYLSGLEAGGGTDLSRAVEELARRAEPGTLAVVVSDLLGCRDDLAGALATLRARRCDAMVVHLISPAAADASLAGPVLLKDAESGAALTLDATDELRDACRAEFQRFCHGVERTCATGGATYVASRIDQPFQQLVLETIRRAGGNRR
jgi:uncharacterized protein (DUF58 family)